MSVRLTALWRVTDRPPADLCTAVAREIGRHKHARMRCRLGFHDKAPWWVPFFGAVEVRRCFRCGCAMEARDDAGKGGAT